jgi:hypothetical protein
MDTNDTADVVEGDASSSDWQLAFLSRARRRLDRATSAPFMGTFDKLRR